MSDGRLAEIYSPFRPFSPDERARIEEQLQATYELFLDASPKGREPGDAKIDGVAQGRVWTGRQARELGLVDELGGLDRRHSHREGAREARSADGRRSGRLSAEADDLRHPRQSARHLGTAGSGARSSAGRKRG